MNGFWRYLFWDNPMNIESLRAVRRFTASGYTRPRTQKRVAWAVGSTLFLVYAWLMVSIAIYREDVSRELLWVEFLLLTLLVPLSLYESISGEREKLTWDSLILTRLSPARIVVGKLLWRLGMAFGVMLTFLTPLLLSHFLSRFPATYALPDLMWLQGFLLSWCVLLATFTLWVSSRTKRSVTTLAAVLTSLIGFLALVPALFAVFGGDNYLRYSCYDASTLMSDRFPPIVVLGSLLVNLNPGYVIGSMDLSQINGLNNTAFYQEFSKPLFSAAPFLYLGLAILCIVGTLRALTRLGLPTRGVR